MEFNQPIADEVLRKIGEIKCYYDAWEAANGGTPLITRSMLAFSLGLEGPAEIDALLEVLGQRGGIIGLQGEMVRLSLELT